MTEFHDWADIRAELHDGDDEGLVAERARTEAWISAFHLAEERKQLVRPGGWWLAYRITRNPGTAEPHGFAACRSGYG